MNKIYIHQRRIEYEKGFTLIELLVVIGIIAVLTGLITFNFNSARARARDVQRKNDMKAMQQVLELYKNNNSQSFPATATWGDKSSGLMLTLITDGSASLAFSDPKETAKSGSWVQYAYVRNTPLTYTLTACLENRSDSDKATVLADCGGATCNCGANSSGVKYVIKQP